MTNALQALDAFNDRFDHPTGSRLGFYGSATQLGGVFTIFITPWIIQQFGRRIAVFGGCVVVIAMAMMQTFATSFEMFVAGKIILGFGTTIAQIAAPVLVAELAYPTQRAKFTAVYNTLIYIGFIIGAWIAYGTRSIPGNPSWQIPCALQAALPAYQALTIWFCPESPRWLISRGQEQKAKAILVKYHGAGVEAALVQAEITEIKAGIEADSTNVRFNWADIKQLISHKGNQRRLFITTVTAVGSQACGSGLISAYLPQVLGNIGMTTTKEQTMITGIVNIWSWVIGVLIAIFIGRLKKRMLFLVGTAGMIAAFIVWTTLASFYERTGQSSYGLGVVAMIFVYNFFYGMFLMYTHWSLQIMLITYSCTFLFILPVRRKKMLTSFIDLLSSDDGVLPPGTLHLKQRSLFFSYTFFCISLFTFIVNYINPVGIANLSWRYYILTIVFTSIVWVLIYFTFVETKGLNLEEVATSKCSRACSNGRSLILLLVFDGKENFDAALTAVRYDNKTAKELEEDDTKPQHEESETRR